MINNESLKKYCAQFNTIDSQVIYDYFYFADSLYPFTPITEDNTKVLFSNLLKNKTIKELSYSFLYLCYEKISSSYKKQFYKIVFYLCDKEYIPHCKFYKLLPLKNIIFSSYVFKNFIYWINLDSQYYNLFLKSNINLESKVSRHLLVLHLEKNRMDNLSFYKVCNDKFENIKFTSNINENTLIAGLETLRRQLYYVANISENNLSEEDFITITRTDLFHSTILFFTLFDLLEKGGYLKNSLVNKTVQLLRFTNKEFGLHSFQEIPDIITTGKPNLWYKLGDLKLLFYNCSNTRTLFILQEFAKQLHHGRYAFELYLKYFDESLKAPNELLSFYSYIEQIKYYKNIKELRTKTDKQDMLTLIHSFYTFYQIYEPDVFSKNGYPTALLTTVKISNFIANDYEVVNHNPLAEVPKSDNWLFCYKDSFSSNLIKVKRLELTQIKNPVFRGWYKSYIWHNNIKMASALHKFKNIRESLNYITDLKTGIELSFFTPKKNDNYGDINSSEIRAFKTYVFNTYSNNQTRLSHIYNLKSLLNYISDNNIHKFNKGVFIELSVSNVCDYSQNPVPIEHLRIIAKRLSDLSNDSVLSHLYYVIFYIAIETSFRASQILSLKIDCVKSTAKQNEYVIYSETKTSNQEEIEQPISVYVKRCIDEAIRLTSEFRTNNTYEELNQNLFIMPTKCKKNSYHRIRKENFNKYLRKICNELTLPRYTFSNLRDFHMTMAEEYIIRQKLSDTQLKVLTHHKSTQTTLKHYSKPSITEILEAVNGVIIGNVDVKGNIIKQLPKDINEHSDLVSDGCGYCSSQICSCFTDIDCLLCEHFVTTVSRKSYFEERIKMLDKMIPSAIHPHDKEDLVNKKRLLLAYLKKIIEQEELNNE